MTNHDANATSTATSDAPSTTPASRPATVPLAWDDFAATCATLGEGAFIATVHADGRPHLAWVMPGWADGKLWFATFADSQKAVNLRAGTEVALHWPQRPDAIALCRADARLVVDPDETVRLWNGGVLPYDSGAFFSSAQDPLLLFVELTPTSASLDSLDPTAPRRRWITNTVRSST